MVEKLKAHKLTLILVGGILFALLVGYFGYTKFIAPAKVAEDQQMLEEVDLAFDPEGPYALLVPRRDGDALVLNIKRTASYGNISYDLAYSDEEGIDRGVSGSIDTEDGKSEYSQEILFGTCSKNVCKYDKGVENGTLVLYITKGNQKFRMNTQWHLQKPELALGVLTSGDNHFSFSHEQKSTSVLPPFTIINELTGVPKLPDGKKVVGKVYALNSSSGSSLGAGKVKIELAEAPPADSKIFLYQESENKWEELNSKIEGSNLLSPASGDGVFAILAPAQ